MDVVNDLLINKRECVFIVRLHGDPPNCALPKEDILGVIKNLKDCDNDDHQKCVLRLPDTDKSKIYLLHTTPPGYNTWSYEVDILSGFLTDGIQTDESIKAQRDLFFSLEIIKSVFDPINLNKHRKHPLIQQLFRYGQLYLPGDYMYNYNLHYEDNSEIVHLLAEGSEIIKKMNCFCKNPEHTLDNCSRDKSENCKLSQIICKEILDSEYVKGCDTILIILTSCNPDPEIEYINNDTTERILVRNILAAKAKINWVSTAIRNMEYKFDGKPIKGQHGMCNNCKYMRDGVHDYKADMKKYEEQVAIMSAEFIKTHAPGGLKDWLIKKFIPTRVADLLIPSQTAELTKLLVDINVSPQDFLTHLHFDLGKYNAAVTALTTARASSKGGGGGRNRRNRKSKSKRSKRMKRMKRSKRSKRRNSRRMKRRSRK
jgi:hypothetical protein